MTLTSSFPAFSLKAMNHLPSIDLVTCDDVIDELKRITKKKLKYLGDRSLEIALLELDKALTDIVVIRRTKYRAKLNQAEKLISHKKDVPILAAVLSVKPEYFLTGDSHFFIEKIKSILNVKNAKEFLTEIKKTR